MARQLYKEDIDKYKDSTFCVPRSARPVSYTHLTLPTKA